MRKTTQELSLVGPRAGKRSVRSGTPPTAQGTSRGRGMLHAAAMAAPPVPNGSQRVRILPSHAARRSCPRALQLWRGLAACRCDSEVAGPGPLRRGGLSVRHPSTPPQWARSTGHTRPRQQPTAEGCRRATPPPPSTPPPPCHCPLARVRTRGAGPEGALQDDGSPFPQDTHRHGSVYRRRAPPRVWGRSAVPQSL